MGTGLELTVPADLLLFDYFDINYTYIKLHIDSVLVKTLYGHTVHPAADFCRKKCSRTDLFLLSPGGLGTVEAQ